MNKNEILDELNDFVEEDIPNFMDSIDVARIELKDQLEKLQKNLSNGLILINILRQERIKSDDD